MAWLTTLTSLNPASWIFLRSTEAPIAEEPMPASQANTTLRTGPESAAAPVPARVEETEDFLPFIDSIEAVAAPRSPSPLSFDMRSSRAPTANETAAATIQEMVTPTMPCGVIDA